MMKRFLLSVILGILCIASVGCTKVIDLTEDQTRLVAEYAADLLLSHDRGYENRLQEGEEALEQENQNTKDDSTEEVTTTEEVPLTETDNSERENPITQGSLDDIAQIIGLQGVSIRYKDYELTGQYPKTGEGDDAVQITAQTGSELLVVHFSIVGTGEQQSEISLVDRDVDYRLVCNDSYAASPMLTILTNDLATLESAVVPGKETEAVLIFQVSDTLKEQLGSMKLHVTYNDTEHVITIL